MMDTTMPRPTSTETSYRDRLRIVQLAAQGWTRPAIATELGWRVPARRDAKRWSIGHAGRTPAIP